MFSQTVRNPAAWRALFSALRAAPLELRSAALEDATALLIRNGANCDALLQQEDWQDWTVPLLCGLPVADGIGARWPRRALVVDWPHTLCALPAAERNAAERSVFQYALNIMVQLCARAFGTSSAFEGVFSKLVHQMQAQFPEVGRLARAADRARARRPPHVRRRLTAKRWCARSSRRC